MQCRPALTGAPTAPRVGRQGLGSRIGEVGAPKRVSPFILVPGHRGSFGQRSLQVGLKDIGLEPTSIPRPPATNKTTKVGSGSEPFRNPAGPERDLFFPSACPSNVRARRGSPTQSDRRSSVRGGDQCPRRRSQPESGTGSADQFPSTAPLTGLGPQGEPGLILRPDGQQGVSRGWAARTGRLQN
jgi:hypothetical protein